MFFVDPICSKYHLEEVAMFRSLQVHPCLAGEAFVVALGALLSSLPACSSSTDTGSQSQDISQIAEPTERGRLYVGRRECATCHGAADGSLSGQDKPQPGTAAYGQNLTPDMDTGIGEWTDDQIRTAIKTGVDDENELLCETMKRFTGMSDDEAADIVVYLRSLQPVRHEVPESHCPPTKP
jgi:mono/diheme cytochrome c family protein